MLFAPHLKLVQGGSDGIQSGGWLRARLQCRCLEWDGFRRSLLRRTKRLEPGAPVVHLKRIGHGFGKRSVFDLLFEFYVDRHS